MRKLLVIILAALVNASPAIYGQQPVFSISFSNTSQKPSDVPVIPWLSRSTPYYSGGMFGKAPDIGDYKPYSEGSFIKRNGDSEQTYVITLGAWRLLAGDRPILGIDQRNTNGAYAQPGILPHLKVRGKIRLLVSNGKTSKYLEDFSDITSIMRAGDPEWICSDKDLQVKLTLRANAFVRDFGCALIARVESATASNTELSWQYENAEYLRDAKSFCEFGYDKYTRIYTGNPSKNAVYSNGTVKHLLHPAKGYPAFDTLVCTWGYTGYDTVEVNNAIKRLRFRPFPSAEWAREMQKSWFQHWIGRGLDPEKKFMETIKDPGKQIRESGDFWREMRSRVIIKTGDERFDNAVRSLGARLISNYEYPGYPHGSNYMKYGKINCGLYAHDAAGFHEEVASTLKFITGAQCVKGRQRYLMPDFQISQWAEEINPYYLDQIWYHYRWTGDTNFLYEMWPSARRALEHLLTTSDPDHDGFFTGIYENWNGDAKDRGGKGALWTGMGANSLRIGLKIATLFEDEDWNLKSQNPKPADNDFRTRYSRLLTRAESAYETLYNRKIGAYSSSDWNSELRNMPGNEESNYMIWRGMGDPLRNYTSMRFIRDNYHQVCPNGIFEYSNKDWPVSWSNHYDSFSDAMSSVASAAMANDIDNYWPLLKTAAEGIYSRPQLTVLAGGASQLSLESDQMFMMALIDNIFGIKPDFGNNRLTIRPSFPSDWKDPEISIPDVSYQYSIKDNIITLRVKTPVPRILDAEIPVTNNVESVLVNGVKTGLKTRKEVNCCRVLVSSEASSSHIIQINLTPLVSGISGSNKCITGKPTVFTFTGPEVVSIENPQIDFGKISLKGNSIEIIASVTGKFTVFAELKQGNASWYHPLELVVKKPWEITKIYDAWDNETGKPAALTSPSYSSRKTLQFILTNNTDSRITGNMDIKINGGTITKKVSLNPGENRFDIPAGNQASLSPGTIPFTIIFNDSSQEAHAINWGIPLNSAGRLESLDLSRYCNADLAKLYGPEWLKWRTDYTGAAVGADWRDTLLIDNLGYKLFVAPTGIISYGILPEQYSPAWWSVPKIPDTLKLPVLFDNIVHESGINNVVALINTENNRSIPSEATIELDSPVNAEKIYFLTANLTKTSKCYYPAAEIDIIYQSGKKETIQMIPPYNMPAFAQAFCPEAYHAPLGTIENNQVLHGKVIPGLSVTDLVTDRSEKIKAIKLRCVTTETVMGVIGISLLKAE